MVLCQNRDCVEVYVIEEEEEPLWVLLIAQEKGEWSRKKGIQKLIQELETNLSFITYYKGQVLENNSSNKILKLLCQVIGKNDTFYYLLTLKSYIKGEINVWTLN